MQELLDKQFLCSGLSFVYRTMIASVPLLDFAIERATGDLLRYYNEHREEERGHDEMLRDDLRRLGVKEIPHSHAAAQMAGAQYYFIAHEHPAMLLGYMHALEKNSLPLEMVDALSAHHGTELTALRHHAKHDPLHRMDLERMIEGLPTALRERVRWNEAGVDKFLSRE